MSVRVETSNERASRRGGAASLDSKTQCVAAGVRGIPIGTRLSVSPRASVTVDRTGATPALGYSVGADAQVQLSQHVSATVSGSYGSNDRFHNDIRGNRSGVTAHAAISLGSKTRRGDPGQAGRGPR